VRGIMGQGEWYRDADPQDEQLDAHVDAWLVKEALLGRVPKGLQQILGRKHICACMSDLYDALQSPTFLRQGSYVFMESVVTALFPELDALVSAVHGRR